MLVDLLSQELLHIGIVVFAGAVLQSFTGFGFALVVAPIAALLAPALLPAPVIALTLLLSLGSTWRGRAAIEWRDFWFIMAGRMPFSILAAIVAIRLNPDWVGLMFGLFLILSVVVTWKRIALEPTPGVLTVAGAISGFFGTLTSVGAPPLAIAYQNHSGPVVRATLGANIVLGSSVSLLALGLADQIEVEVLVVQTLATVPFLLAGGLMGDRLAGKASPGFFRHLTLVVCLAAAALLAIRASLVLSMG